MADFVKNDKRNNNNGKKNFNRNNNTNNRPKNNDYGSKKPATVTAPDVCAGTVEYTMSKTMADEIIKAAKGKSGKLSKPAQEVLCNYVNTQMGLKGYCVKVLIDIN